jgi:uncharacterized repeat protein (TIGR01451 family)
MLQRRRATFLAVVGVLLAIAGGFRPRPVHANATPHNLCVADTPAAFAQDWSNAGLITANDDWSAVPSVEGFRGDGLTATTGVDPRTIAGDGTPVLDVNANQTDPSTFATGGATEFELTNPVVALVGSTTARAPHLILTLNSAGTNGATISYTVRDIDGSSDNAAQQFNVQYRVGTSGAWTNVPGGYIADASAGPSLTQDTPVAAYALPAGFNDAGTVQIRFMTADAAGNDEWLGVDDIVVTPTCAPVDPCAPYSSPYTLSSNSPAELIQAITCANANGASADVIDLGGQTVTLTTGYEQIFGAWNGLPAIRAPLTLRNGTITRGGTELFRILLNTSSLTLTNITVSNGNPGADGGGIYNDTSGTLVINQGRVLGNTGNFGGGIFNTTGSSVTLNNTLVAGNRAQTTGGGIRNRGNLTLNNSTVAANYDAGSVGGRSGGIANAGTYTLVLNNSLVYGNEASSNPEISGTYTSNSSLVGVDPAFVNLLDASSNAPTSGGDYRLGAGSAAVDAGANSLIPGGATTDLAGAPRRFDDAGVADTGVGTAPIVDIGAYERQVASLADITITKTDGQTSATSGTSVTYTIVASNAGPAGAPSVAVADAFPGQISGVTWTCVGAGGGTCAASGSGDINAVVGLPAGASVTFTASGTIDPAAAAGTLSNTATATLGGGLSDPSPGNNSATDTTIVRLPPGVLFDQSGGTVDVAEGGALDLYSVVLASQPTADVAVELSYDGQVELSSDGVSFAAAPLVLTFTPANWNVARTLVVQAVNDSVAEGDHSSPIAYSVTSADADYDGLSVADTTVSLADNDTASISIIDTSSAVAEDSGPGSHEVTARLDIVANGAPGGTLGGGLTADVVLTAGTATAGADYAASTATFSFSAGSANGATRPITITIVNDRLLEEAETFTVSAAISSGAGTAGGTHVVSILDDEVGAFTFAQASGSVSEAGGTYSGQARFTITGSGAGTTFSTQGAVGVALTQTPGTAATPDDYSLPSITLSVAAGAAAPLDLPFDMAIVDDALDEGDETFTLGFGAVTGPASAAGTHTVTIADDDTAGVSLSTTTVAVAEGGATASYTVVLTSQPSAAVTVTPSPDGQIAVSPASLIFTPANWSTPQTVTVTAADDQVVEGEHSGAVAHSAAGGDYGAVGAASVTASIADDDTATYQFTAPTSSAGEAAGSAAVGVALSFNTSGSGEPRLAAPVTVGFTVSASGTAAGLGVDYTLGAASVTFPASGAAQTVIVALVDDLLAEPDETLILFGGGAGPPPAAVLGQVAAGSPARHTLTIVDNDDAPATTYRVHLPLLVIDRATDLVVERISTQGGRLAVVIANQGDTPISTPFWVDLLVAPTRAPAAPNDTWERLGSRGFVWGVTASLAPGERLTLTINDRFYRSAQSNFSQTVDAGTQLYGHVDSANTNTTYGAVLEDHERDGGPYNNVRAATATEAISPPTARAAGTPNAGLPQR